MQPNKTGGLVAVVGGIAAAALMHLVPSNEATVYKTYKDLGGVLTYCDGATENAIWGKTYTPQECAAQLDRDLTRHAVGIAQCIPMDKLTDGQKVAFVDTAYNIGISAFCKSGMARKTNQGDMPGACASLSLWINVNGKPVKGLINRRATARAFCEGKKPV